PTKAPNYWKRDVTDTNSHSESSQTISKLFDGLRNLKFYWTYGHDGVKVQEALDFMGQKFLEIYLNINSAEDVNHLGLINYLANKIKNKEIKPSDFKDILNLE